MKKQKFKRSKKGQSDPNKWMVARSIKFDKNKLEKAKQLGTIKLLSEEARKALDKLIA